MAGARFGCADCPTFAADTIEEFTDHAKANHPGAFLSKLYRVERRPNRRPEIYLAHCIRCAAEIRSTTPNPSLAPRCPACEENVGGALEFQSRNAEAAVVNPTRSDPKETRMNRTETIAALKALNVPGRFQTMKTADLVALLAANTPAAVEIVTDADVAAAAEAIARIADVLDGVDVTPPAEDDAVPPVEVPVVEVPATDKIAAIVNKGERIPAGAATFVCRNCGRDLPTKKFPTVTGPSDRATTCRECRDGSKGTSRPAKAAKKATAKKAGGTAKAAAAPKGLDPATAPFGIGGTDVATIDRTYKAAWAAAADENGVIADSDVADRLRAAHRAAHDAIVVRRAKKAA
jgi:hypothetical protein